MQKNGIRAFRRRIGISQTELARRGGTSRQQISRLEKGDRKLTTDWAVRLAEVLDCSPTDLLFPDKAKLHGPGYHNVFFMGAGRGKNPDRALSFPEEILHELIADPEHGPLELIRVDDLDITATARQGDYLLIDRGVRSVTGPGLYQIQIVDSTYWRYLTPSVTGKIIVKSDDDRVAAETVDEGQIVILGRARAKLSPV